MAGPAQGRAGQALVEFLGGVGDTLQGEFEQGRELAKNPPPLRKMSFAQIVEQKDLIDQRKFEATIDPVLAVTTLPIVGDILGAGLDLHGFITGKLEPTPFNIGLASVGVLLPGIPALSSIKKITGGTKDVRKFMKRSVDNIKSLDDKAIAARRELGTIKAKATEFFPENFTAFDDEFLEAITIAPSGFFTMPDETFFRLYESGKFASKATLSPQKALVKFRSLERQAAKLADQADEFKLTADVARDRFQESIKVLPDDDRVAAQKLLFGDDAIKSQRVKDNALETLLDASSELSPEETSKLIEAAFGPEVAKKLAVPPTPEQIREFTLRTGKRLNLSDEVPIPDNVLTLPDKTAIPDQLIKDVEEARRLKRLEQGAFNAENLASIDPKVNAKLKRLRVLEGQQADKARLLKELDEVIENALAGTPKGQMDLLKKFKKSVDNTEGLSDEFLAELNGIIEDFDDLL